jgi:hypothetical protein
MVTSASVKRWHRWSARTSTAGKIVARRRFQSVEKARAMYLK